MRRPALSAALLAAAASVGGCGGGDGGGDSGRPTASGASRAVTAAVAQLPGSLDPALATTPAERAVSAAVQTPLLVYKRRTDADAAVLEPALAKELPELSEDFTEYRFNLRPGLLYADGRLVKASDVERSIAHASQVAADRELRATLASILGAPSEDGETLSGVRTDDRTGAIVVLLRKPDGRIPLALADPATAPLPELPSGKPGALPASTGSLRVARLTDDSVELVTNPLRAQINTVPAAKSAQVSVTDREPTLRAVGAGEIDVDLQPGPGPFPSGSAIVAAAGGGIWSLLLAPEGAMASRPARESIADAIDRRVLGRPGAESAIAPACGLLPAYVVGAVIRDDCPPAPVVPADPPLRSVALRIAMKRGGTPAGREATQGVDSLTIDGPPGSVSATVVRGALTRLGAFAEIVEVADPLAALASGRADAAIVLADPTLPHPAGWLTPAATVDALLKRELPKLSAGPLTGSGGDWSSLERRAVDRAVAIPLLAEQATALAGPGVDRSSVLLHPVLGPDLTELKAR